MPKDFERCVDNGGKVRTVSGPSKKHGLKDNEYVKYCTDKNGKTHRGEVKKKSKRTKNSRNNTLQQGAPMALQDKMKVPQSSLCINDEATVELSDKDNDDNRYASLLAYSGKIIKGHWLWGDLAIDVSGIQFKQKRNPILEQHDIFRKIGFSNKLPNVDNNRIEFEEIRLLNNEVANEFYDNSKAGFPYQSSISIRPLVIEELAEGESTEVNGMSMKGPGTIFRKSQYRETSVCVFGYDSNTKAQALSESDDKTVELSVDIIRNSNSADNDADNFDDPNNGGTIMNLKELKEQYPQVAGELAEEIKAAFSDEIKKKDDEIATLKQNNSDLSEKNKGLGERITSLENESILRKENELKTIVHSQVSAKLSESNIPTRLHDRLIERFSYSNYVTDKNEIDSEKLSKEIDEEIKHWETALSESSPSNTSVRGFSKTSHVANPTKSTQDFTDEDATNITKRILSHVGIKSAE